jgi:hypothetical protein
MIARGNTTFYIEYFLSGRHSCGVYREYAHF